MKHANKKIEDFLNKIYKPKIDPQKREKLFKLSIIILFIFTTISILNYYYNGTNDNIYYLCGGFNILGLIGLFVSKYGTNFWVALIYGDWSI